MNPLWILIPAGFFGIIAVHGLMTGRMFGRNGWIYRDDDPTLFAVGQGVAISTCAVLTAWVIAMVW